MLQVCKDSKTNIFERYFMLGKWVYELNFVSLLRYRLSEVLQTP